MCNICEDRSFCNECTRKDEPPLAVPEAPKKNDNVSRTKLAKPRPRKLLPRIEGNIFILESKRFHIISSQKTCNGKIELSTKEGITFYLREVKKDKSAYLSLIKQVCNRKSGKKKQKGDEILQLLPSLEGRNPSIFTADSAW